MATPDRYRWARWADRSSSVVGLFAIGLNTYLLADMILRAVSYLVR